MKGNYLINSLVENNGGVDLAFPWTYLWSGNDKTNIERFIKDSSYLVEYTEGALSVLGSTIGAHIGPGAVGIAFFKKKDD